MTEVPSVLIVSAAEDAHAQAVGRELAAIGARPVLLDLREFPCQLSVYMQRGEADRTLLRQASGAVLDTERFTSVWWRRPQPVRAPDSVTHPDHRHFVNAELLATLDGVWAALRCPWVNPPALDRAANCKPYQLSVARKVGLDIPDTLVTNDVAGVEAFLDRHGDQVIYKALLGTPGAWRETRAFPASERAHLEAVRLAPVIFQERLPGHDIRVTIIGDRFFAAEFDTSKSAYPLDIRMDMRVPVEAVELDAELQAKLSQLMASLGLRYGAIDLRRRADGSAAFLEINPAGQFLHIETLLGLPITNAVASYLAAPDQATHEPTNWRLHHAQDTRRL